VCKAT
jgi:CubicO group peptidase (beta-lactamase class C family)